MRRRRLRYTKMLDRNDIKEMKSIIPDFEVMGAFNPGACGVDGGYVLFLRVPEAPRSRVEKGSRYQPIYCSPRFEFEDGRIKLDGDKPKVAVDEFTLRRDCRLDDERGIHLNDDTYRLPTISFIRRAWSPDGRSIEKIEEGLAIPASSLTMHEEYGLEDPKIVRMEGKTPKRIDPEGNKYGEKEYVVSSVAPSSTHGIVTVFRETDDLRNFSKPWIVTLPECKDTFPFPEKINGRYWEVARPSKGSLTKKQSIYLGYSDDLGSWGGFRVLMSCRDGCFDSDGIGPSAPAIKTERGWLIIYHGVRNKIYRNGVVLMDDKLRITARSRRPLFERRRFDDDETPGITFVSAAALEDGGNRPENKTLRVFGGEGDKYPFSAEIPLSDVFDSLEYFDKREYHAATPTMA